MLDPRKKLLELQIPCAPPKKVEKNWKIWIFLQTNKQTKKTESKNNVLAYFSSNIWPTS